MPRIGLSIEPAVRSARAAAALRANATKATDPAAPLRVQLVRLPAGTTAADGCSAIMALHAAVIAHNLQCVLTTLDPEGPHQLRVALRRTRVALRVFKPVMKKQANADLTASARDLGAIVGELRDADVMIDEIIAPAARDQTALRPALNAWRQEVRGRVRARLLATNAAAFADTLARGAASGGWIKKNLAALPAAPLVGAALVSLHEKAAAAASRLPGLSHLDLHELRKDVKALRYGTELAAAAGAAAIDAAPLKRMQDLLGYANDMAALAQFDPPLSGQRDVWRALRARILSAREEGVANAVADAAREWNAITRAWMSRDAAA